MHRAMIEPRQLPPFSHCYAFTLALPCTSGWTTHSPCPPRRNKIKRLYSTLLVSDCLVLPAGSTSSASRNDHSCTVCLPPPFDPTHQYIAPWTDPAAHAAYVGIFGVIGYYVYWGDQRVQELIREKRVEIAERRAARAQSAADAELYQIEAQRQSSGAGIGI
jgi:hypothetical protein